MVGWVFQDAVGWPASVHTLEVEGHLHVDLRLHSYQEVAEGVSSACLSVVLEDPRSWAFESPGVNLRSGLDLAFDLAYGPGSDRLVRRSSWYFLMTLTRQA